MLEQDDKNNFGFQRRKGVFVLNLWQMGGAYHTKEEWLFPVTQSSVCFMSGKPHPAGAHRAVKQTKQCEFTLVVPCGCETATAGRKRNKRLKVRTRRPQVTGEINETIALYMGHWNRLETSDPQSERGYLWSFSSCARIQMDSTPLWQPDVLVSVKCLTDGSNQKQEEGQQTQIKISL